MPNVSVVELSTRAVLRHRRGERVQRLAAHLVGPPDLRVGDRQAGKLAGVNDTVWVLFAGTVTLWLTVIGVPRPAG